MMVKCQGVHVHLVYTINTPSVHLTKNTSKMGKIRNKAIK